MATELHYNDAGTWRDVKEVHYNDAGTWRALKEAWYNDAGTWRKVFQLAAILNPIPAITLDDDQLYPTNASAQVRFHDDGTITVAGNGSTTGGLWYSHATAGIGSSYWVRVTKNSGSNNTSGSALGTWVSISTNPSWTWSQIGLGSKSANLTIEIASDAAGATIVATESSVPVSVVCAT